MYHLRKGTYEMDFVYNNNDGWLWKYPTCRAANTNRHLIDQPDSLV